MMRKILLLLILLLTFMSVGFTVQAEENECRFALSDANVSKGRIFEVNLTAKSRKKLSSFIGEITFDSGSLEYRSAKCVYDTSLVSVNANETGKITFVYLCEEGQSCVAETEILTLRFKANVQGQEELSLNIRDAVDSSGKDLSALTSKGSSVVVSSSSGSKKTADGSDLSDDGDSLDEATSDESKQDGFTSVKGNTVNVYLICSGIATLIVALIVVAYIFYKLGVRAHKKSSEKEVKEEKKDEEKT